MHRKSLEAAHQLTSGDESNKDDDDEPGGGNNGGHSSGDETDEHIHPDDDHHKREPKISSNKPQQQHHHSHLLHLPGPTPTSSAQQQHDASSYMAITNYAAQLQQQRSSVTTINPTDDFRLNSVAELRAKAAEHQARIAGFGIQQQPPPQRDGEFLISSDSSSSF